MDSKRGTKKIGRPKKIEGDVKAGKKKKPVAKRMTKRERQKLYTEKCPNKARKRVNTTIASINDKPAHGDLYGKWVAGKEAAIRAAVRNGYRDSDIQRLIGCSSSTFYTLKGKFQEFYNLLVVGRELADLEVEDALFRRVIGETWEERNVVTAIDSATGQPVVKEIRTGTRRLHPDAVAALNWLYNRKSESWKKDRKESDKPNESGNTMTIEDVLSAVKDSIGSINANDYSGIDVGYKKSKLEHIHSETIKSAEDLPIKPVKKKSE